MDRNSETLEPNCFLRNFWKLLAYNVLPLCLVAYFRHLTIQKYTKYWFSDKNSDKNWTSHETKRLLLAGKIGFLNVNMNFKLNSAFRFSTFSFLSFVFQLFISLNIKRKSSEARYFKSIFLAQNFSRFSFQILFGRKF